MDVEFKFAIGDRVEHVILGIRGSITSASITRMGILGYWLEYIAHGSGEVKELYVLESELRIMNEA